MVIPEQASGTNLNLSQLTSNLSHRERKPATAQRCQRRAWCNYRTVDG
jgi:hypothetical protein